MKLGFIVFKSAASLVRKLGAGESHAQFDERDLETEDGQIFRHRQPKGSETVKAEPTSTAPDLDSTPNQGLPTNRRHAPHRHADTLP
jgi:hypothetical protein